jgi:hypothetical protein
MKHALAASGCTCRIKVLSAFAFLAIAGFEKHRLKQKLNIKKT